MVRRSALQRASWVALATALALTAVLALTTGAAAANSDITIRKFVNGQQANLAPGPSVESGSRVRFRYEITVGSSEELYDFVVTDSAGVTPDCDLNGDGSPDGFNRHPGPLRNGDRFVCFASETAGNPGVVVASFGRVKAFNIDVSSSFEAEAVTHYKTVAPTTTSSSATTSTSEATTSSAPAVDTTVATTASSSRSSSAGSQQQPSSTDETTTLPRSSILDPSIGGGGSTQGTRSSAADPTTSSIFDSGTTNGPPGPSSSQSSDDPTTAPDDAADSRPDVTPEAEVAEAEMATAAQDQDGTDPDAGSEGEPDGGASGDDPRPAALAFADEVGFSFTWAVISAVLGGGVAFASDRQNRRRRDSAPSSGPTGPTRD